MGWARLYPWSARKAYDRTAELGIYVHRDHRGRGVGRARMRELLERARRSGVCVLIARVVEGNPASLALHESFGF
jgi:phosphinothricin acetyltransferase